MSILRSKWSIFISVVAALLLLSTFAFLGFRAHTSFPRSTESVGGMQKTKNLENGAPTKPGPRISTIQTNESFREVIMDLGASVPTVIASLNLSIPYRYHRVLPAKCWIGDCRGRNNWRAYRPCSFNGTLDESAVASEYNALGVRTIERMLSSLIVPSAIEEQAVLERAVTFFRAALKRDPRCLSASMNLAVVHLKMGYNKGVQDSIQSIPDLLLPKRHSYELAFIKSIEEFINERDAKDHRKQSSSEHWRTIFYINNSTITDYRGAFLMHNKDMELPKREGLFKHLTSMIFWKYFAETSLLQYSLFSPTSPDEVAREGWTVLRNVYPPYLFEAYRQCSIETVNDRSIVSDDRAHGRLEVVNDRCSVFMGGQLTDIISTIAGTQLEPTFMKLALYQNSSSLGRHSDNDLCIWSVSLTVNMTSPRVAKDFPLGLTDYRGNNVLSELYENDGMVLMGHALPHFREGSPAKGDTLIQAFYHWKEELGLMKPIIRPPKAAAKPTQQHQPSRTQSTKKGSPAALKS